MSRLITNDERLKKAVDLIRQARELPTDSRAMFMDIGYVAQVKDLLRQARDLVKFIPFSAGADIETKLVSKEILQQIERTEKELLHRS
jgi:hypothetical protein